MTVKNRLEHCLTSLKKLKSQRNFYEYKIGRQFFLNDRMGNDVQRTLFFEIRITNSNTCRQQYVSRDTLYLIKKWCYMLVCLIEFLKLQTLV